MKSYTNIEESKKLAEILPLESADMCFNDNEPCWSLAALLDQLEDVICDEDGNEWELVLKKENVQYDIYYLIICGEQDNIELDRFYDDLIDCCYEMIVKLKEKDLL